MSDDQYNGLPPGGKATTGGQPFTAKRGAMTHDIDYTEFDALFAEQIISGMGGERARRAIAGLIKQSATKEQIVGRLKKLLPTWEGTAVQLAVVVDYLQNGGGVG